MRLLLDTHAFLWAVSGSEKLSQTAANAFLSPNNQLHFSIVSYWEICIKHTIGKLDLARNWTKIFDSEMALNGIQWLSLEQSHCQGTIELPFIHGDPFDRLLISQAITEEFTLVTKDKQISQYNVPTLW